MQDDSMRRAAERHLETGVHSIIHAFNLSKDQDWHFEPTVTASAHGLCVNLIRLFHASEIQPDPRAVTRLRSAIRAARADRAFQAFLATVKGVRSCR